MYCIIKVVDDLGGGGLGGGGRWGVDVSYLPKECMVLHTNFPHAFSMFTGHEFKTYQALELLKLQRELNDSN